MSQDSQLVLKRSVWNVYLSVLSKARRTLKLPDAPEEMVSQQLLALPKVELERFAERLGLKYKYLRYDLLSIAGMSKATRKALKQGLSLRDARALEARLEVSRGGRGLQGHPPIGEAQVLEALRAVGRPEDKSKEPTAAERLSHLLRPAGPVDSWAKKPVWIFPANRAARGREVLDERVVEALLRRYARGGFVIDPMAGSGGTLRVARQLKLKAWGGDINPPEGSPHVEKWDIRALSQKFRTPVADLILLHPPTYSSWKKLEGRRKAQDQEGPYFEYMEHIKSLVECCLAVLRPGGHLVLVGRPLSGRARGGRDGHAQHIGFVAPFERAVMESVDDGRLRPVAYHNAVADDGLEQWAVFVAQSLPDGAG